ncbi:myotubularin-related protein 3-like isoform X1 [Mangifera indica]|uniref:myotubularin-related protein 3-like isoform X1 n=1 Tax=Mangifera indica TaxID=29780 RepID=UPI001CFA7A37|nr:myotubularin-related protein 3-like isoform X1 [Mangifera indica]
MPLEPPPFQEAARCDVCKCSFNTFRRRHHCRCCGRTLCHEHSANQMALPQFGIHTIVRVCADCFNNSSRAGNDNLQTSPDGVNPVTDTFSRLDIGADVDEKMETVVEHRPVSGVVECKCGMPLCICKAPAPTLSTDARPLPMKNSSSSTARSNPKSKKTDTVPRNRGSTSNSKVGSVFNPGQVTNVAMDTPQPDYDVNGEGLREAIKNGDTAAVKKLLSEQGVDANFHDKQGMSLLHLAALFNRTDIAFILMEYGASMEYRNPQGETPLDCAPATLQYKMRQKIEEKHQ